MMERVTFVMGNVCDKLEKVEKCGNESGAKFPRCEEGWS
jgi:hypothetical protein